MKKSMVDCYGYQYFMDLSSSCMELGGGQEPRVWTSPWKFKTIYIPIHPPPPQTKFYRFLHVI